MCAAYAAKKSGFSRAFGVEDLRDRAIEQLAVGWSEPRDKNFGILQKMKTQATLHGYMYDTFAISVPRLTTVTYTSSRPYLRFLIFFSIRAFYFAFKATENTLSDSVDTNGNPVPLSWRKVKTTFWLGLRLDWWSYATSDHSVEENRRLFDV